MVDQARAWARALGAAGLGDRWWVAWPLLTFLMLLPTLLHGRPYVYWDTAQYFHYGEQLSAFAAEKIGRLRGHGSPELRSAVPSSTSANSTVDRDKTDIEQKSKAGGIVLYGARSPFYSIWLYTVADWLSLWGMVLVQAAAAAWLIWRAALQVARSHALVAAAAVAGLAGFASSAWFFVGFVMADAYAAIGLFAAALLMAYGAEMSRWERVAAAALLFAAALFHLTHLAVAIAMVLSGIAAAFFWRWARGQLRTGVVIAGAALVLAIAAQLTFSIAARAVLGVAPKYPPFLMARVIADGPGRAYLAKVCPGTAPYFICAFRDRHLVNSDAFLWSDAGGGGVFQTVSVEDRLKLIEEQPRFVAAVITNYPLETVAAMLANIAKQIVLIVPEEAWVDAGITFADPGWRSATLFQVAPFLKDCVARPGLCVPAVPKMLIAILVAAATLISLMVMAIHFARQIQRRNGSHSRAVFFALLIAVGLLANAVLCGALSNPSARYQSRIVWLAVVAACLLEVSRPIVTTDVRRRLRQAGLLRSVGSG